ncbi:MAG: hypothetical protein QW156_04470 [Candidatus Aenigmatarchaeota archaeon]
MNVNKVKRYVGMVLLGILPLATFYFVIWFGYDLLIAIISSIISLILGIVILNVLIRNPFMKIIEGKGILAINLDSSGAINPFVLSVDFPIIKSSNPHIESIFDRNLVFQFKPPREGIIKKIDEDEKYERYVFIVRKASSYPMTFQMFGFPTLIYNKATDTFLTKEALANLEKNLIIKHQILYLKAKVQELTSIMRDFARYVVETTKPRLSLFGLVGKWWFWLLIIGAIIIIAIMFAPSIFGTIKQTLPTMEISPIQTR